MRLLPALRHGLPLAVLLLLPAAAQDADALFNRGVQAYAAENYDQAMKLFEQAVASRPEVSQYHYWLGKTAGRRAEHAVFFRAVGLAKKTRSEFERAVELDPANVGALNDLLEYYLEAPGMLGGGEDKARPIAAKLEKIDPAEGHRARALISAKKKDYAGAEEHYREALKLEPRKPGRLLDLASFLAERGRYAESDALFDRAAALAPDSPELWFARGKALVLARREPEKAREMLERYLQSPRRPDDPPPSEVRELLKKL